MVKNIRIEIQEACRCWKARIRTHLNVFNLFKFFGVVLFTCKACNKFNAIGPLIRRFFWTEPHFSVPSILNDAQE
jgi:hypothetical protein